MVTVTGLLCPQKRLQVRSLFWNQDYGRKGFFTHYVRVKLVMPLAAQQDTHLQKENQQISSFTRELTNDTLLERCSEKKYLLQVGLEPMTSYS